MLKNAALFFISLGVSTYIVDLFSDHALANAFARMRCGSDYLQHVTVENGIQVLHTLPCGLGADASMFVICLTVVLCGLAILAIPKLHPKQEMDKYE